MTMTNPETASSGRLADIRVVPGTFKVDVVPGVFFAEPGGTYWIRNHTNYWVVVTLSDRIVEHGKTLELEPAGSSGESASFMAISSGSGVHQYTVRVTFARELEEGLYATGGSNPRIVFN